MQGRAPARPAFREISGDFFWWRRLLPQMRFRQLPPAVTALPTLRRSYLTSRAQSLAAMK